MKTCAILGPEGTFTEEAANACLAGDYQLVYAADIDGVFEQVLKGTVDAGMAPVNNSLAGSIPATIKNLINHQVYIAGEITLPVKHYLLGTEQMALQDIEVVISMPAVFLQCERFLRENLPWARKEIVESTATAAKLVKTDNRKAAAIGPRQTADVYNLEIIREGLEDESGNCTTFVMLSRKEVIQPNSNKISVIFGLKDYPGALYHALGVFATRNVNLSKLESRPRGPRSQEYLFVIDIEGGINEPLIEEALNELQGMAAYYKYLGCYPVTERQMGIANQTAGNTGI
ncbi:MAG: prephenate dehydratase [Acidobacteriota bacterium]